MDTSPPPPFFFSLVPFGIGCFHCHCVIMQGRVFMESISVNKFRDNLKYFVERVINNHLPLKVTRRAGEAFVVISAEDWAREQETLYVLQNCHLMRQIEASKVSHKGQLACTPSKEELDEIVGI